MRLSERREWLAIVSGGELREWLLTLERRRDVPGGRFRLGVYTQVRAIVVAPLIFSVRQSIGSRN